MQSIATAAVAFALAGWHVLPVGPDKKPIASLVPHGLASATTEADTVASWYANDAPYNVAIVIPARHLVVDVDDAAALAALERVHGPLPSTREARTGSGGRHLWFTTTRNDLIQRKLAPGVDTRVAGKGYVVAPPSVHANGTEYVWRDEGAAIAPAPAWIVDALAPAAEPTGTDGNHPAGAGVGASVAGEALARHYLATCDAAVSGQGGHDATMRAAGVVVRGLACGEALGLDLLREVYNPRCIPPWSEKELRHKAHDAATASREPAWGSMLGTTPAATRAPRKTLAERFQGLTAQGTQLRTGLATLDTATRGGLRTGKVVFVGGAPGACKTAMVVQLAVRWAGLNIPVSFIAADEEADAIAIRIGQMGGLVREHLEAGTSHAIEAASSRASDELAALELVDGEDEGAYIEDVAASLRKRAGDGPAVLVVDSLQTAAIRAKIGRESRREEIDAVVGALKAAAKRHGLLVVATTELARGSYRSKNTAEQIDDLAAAKESGGIEYAASLLLVLRSVAGTPNRVDVAMPKNRLGQKLPFRFALDFERATIAEVERPADKTPQDRFAALKVAVMTAVRIAAENSKPYKSGSAVARDVDGRKADILEALKELEVDGELVNDGRVIRPKKGVGS